MVIVYIVPLFLQPSPWVQHFIACMVIDGIRDPSSLPSGKLLQNLPSFEEVEEGNGPYFELL